VSLSLSSRRITLALGPHGLSLDTGGDAVHSVAQLLSLQNLPAALDAVPEAVTPRRARVEVTIDNAWTRWQVVDMPPGVSGADEQQALVRARMIEVFGTTAQGWTFAWDTRPADGVLACGMDAALLRALEAWCAARALGLHSVQPDWLRAYAHFRGSAALGGFAQLRHGWLCLGLWSGRRWLHMRGEALSDPAGLATVLERRLNLLDGDLSGGQLFLHGAPAVSLPRGWRCVASGVAA
jgi:hypothetical protein